MLIFLVTVRNGPSGSGCLSSHLFSYKLLYLFFRSWTEQTLENSEQQTEHAFFLDPPEKLGAVQSHFRSHKYHYSGCLNQMKLNYQKLLLIKIKAQNTV